jgi:hypothetical protein
MFRIKKRRKPVSDSARQVRFGIKKVHVQNQEAPQAREVLSVAQEGAV